MPNTQSIPVPEQTIRLAETSGILRAIAKATGGEGC